MKPMFNQLRSNVNPQRVLAIAQAVVDVAFRVTEEELVATGLEKGTYQKVDSKTLEKLLKAFGDREHSVGPGGSVANSVDTLGSFGIPCELITGLGEDPYGDVFGKAYLERGIDIFNAGPPGSPTGACAALITPDGERTMCTHLGASEVFRHDALEAVQIQPHTLLLVEGYVLRGGFGPKTLQVVHSFVARVKQEHGAAILSLPPVSVLRALETQSEQWLDSFDIVHGNRDEFCTLLEVCSMEEVCSALARLPIGAVVTDGGNGATAVVGEHLWTVPAETVEIVDLTGAGDAFLAGWVSAALRGMSVDESLRRGGELAARIISKVGARLD